MSTPFAKLPAWVDYGLMPVTNVLAGFLIAGLVVMFIGESPLNAVGILFDGAFGSINNIFYTLFYATSFIFTGLSVAVAFHAGLFNIGGEGQAYIGGLGVGLVALALDRYVPWYVTAPLAIAGSNGIRRGMGVDPCMAAGQARQPYRHHDHHVQFHRRLVDGLRDEQIPEAGRRDGAVVAPSGIGFVHSAFGSGARLFRHKVRLGACQSYLFVALVAAWLVWKLIWRTKFGYEMRTFGFNPSAASYAGISAARVTILTMLISGGLAGLMAVNTVLGSVHKIELDFVAGAGFVGIAVALMGRSHPVGVVLAALLFGALYQGGAELSFAVPAISRDMILVIQALVILFAGALENLFRPFFGQLFTRNAAPAGA